MNEDDFQQEAQERREAEIEYVTSAYNQTEAWIEKLSNNAQSNNCPSVIEIHRKVDLPPTFETVELILTMPKEYPVKIDSTLLIDAFVTNSNKSAPLSRRKAMNAIPSLLLACREEALSYSGEEAVFAVLQRADDWIETEWKILSSTEEKEKNSNDTSCNDKKVPETFILERRLIYSHHIIASSKRRAISDLSKHYNLGGYSKIGWPGIMVIEGDQADCQKFFEEIKSMRWQYLVVRGEQTFLFSSSDEMKSNYVFQRGIVELGEDDMSILSKNCRDVGLEELFMTSFKKYTNTTDSGENHIEPVKSFTYGALVLLDHMNNYQVYHTFLRNVTKEANCAFANFNYKNENNHIPRKIIILVLGLSEVGVKQVLKQWRISKGVDVDKKGKACKERMMTVLIEGDLIQSSSCELDLEALEESYDDTSTIENIVDSIGGGDWLGAIRI